MLLENYAVWNVKRYPSLPRLIPYPLPLKPTLTLTTKVGKVTRLIRAENKADKEEQVEVRKKKADTRYEDNIRKKAKRAAIRDHAETILHTSLVTSISELETQLQARCTSAAARVCFMKEQFHARVSGESPRDYRGLGPEFRGVHGKLKLTPSDGTGKEAYLLALIKAMIGEDGDLLANPNGMPKLTQDFMSFARDPGMKLFFHEWDTCSRRGTTCL